MLPQEIIRSKRDVGELDPADIADFVRGLTDGSVSEGQVAALAMAIFFQGMARQEAVALTLAMRDSGEVPAYPRMSSKCLRLLRNYPAITLKPAAASSNKTLLQTKLDEAKP